MTAALLEIDVAELNTRTPMISPGSTHPETTAGKSFVFRVTFLDLLQGEALARFAAGELGAQKAAVLYDIANAYNRNLAAIFRQAFEAAGGEVVAFEPYTTGDRDFRDQLRSIRDAGPELLFLPNYAEEIPPQAHQARGLGIDAKLLGSDGWTLIPFADLPQLEGACFSQDWHLALAETNPEAQRFISMFRRAYGHDPSDQAALTYDALGLLFHALRSAGDDPEEIRQALADIEAYPGVTGAITYRGTGGDPRKPVMIVQVRQGATVRYGGSVHDRPPPAQPGEEKSLP